MNKKIVLLVVAIIAVASAASAQGRKQLRINEVMVQNDSNYVDDYGLRHGWIELYNSAFAPMEISSVYLTDDPSQPKKYPVPLGDINTEIPARQHVLFWADGEPNKGTFHLNFKLKPGQPNWIGVYDANGITLIDSITVPASLAANHTFARKRDGEGTGIEAWEVRDGSDELYITPSSNNRIVDTNKKVEMFERLDADGFGLTLMAMGIVFSALLVLSLSFLAISKIGQKVNSFNKLKAHGLSPKEVAKEERPEVDSGEAIAAITMALYEHLNAHDQENTVLTINKVKRAYSPWSSKIYTLRETPVRH